MSIKLVVNTKDSWESLVEVFDDKIAKLQVSLEQATSIEEVYRLQGSISALRRLKYLRDEVNGSK